MSLLDSLISTTTPAPPKMIVYGQPGAGKTTFAASAGAILIDCENGAAVVPGLTRTPYLESWAAMREWLIEIATSDPAHAGVLAVDTIDWMVQRIIEHVVIDLDGKAPDAITNTLGTAHGGYFKAREIVQNIVYRDLLPVLNAAASRGWAVILLAHAANAKMTAPEGYDMRMAAPDLPPWLVAPVCRVGRRRPLRHPRGGAPRAPDPGDGRRPRQEQIRAAAQGRTLLAGAHGRTHREEGGLTYGQHRQLQRPRCRPRRGVRSDPRRQVSRDHLGKRDEGHQVRQRDASSRSSSPLSTATTAAGTSGPGSTSRTRTPRPSRSRAPNCRPSAAP